MTKSVCSHSVFWGLFIILFFSHSSGQIRYIDVAKVPSWFPVNFALYTKGNNQFIAFYDSLHNLTIASRNLESENWKFSQLDSKVGWDSHNYLSLLVDSLGFIHLVGNMHSSPMIYFKSSKPYDIYSMTLMDKMTGREEDVTTYPKFIETSDEEVVFHYRYGISGNGYEVYNKLNVIEQKWERLLDVPLIDGKNLMNAYMEGPVFGPDNHYHIIWVWRDTWDCSTNHTLSYARSKDLIHWESMDGNKVNLPLVIDYKELFVDTTKAGGGLINIGIKIGFDDNDNVLIGYHKYDDTGNTQLFIARFENHEWISRQTTNWDYRWDFKGMGTIENKLLIESPFMEGGKVIFGYHHKIYGDGQVLIDQSSLEPISNRKFIPNYPASFDNVMSEFPDMQVNIVPDSGERIGGKKYLLRWETLPPNRDEKREGILPPASILQLVEINEN